VTKPFSTFRLLLAAALTLPLSAQFAPYDLKVESRAGLLIVTFTTQTGQARAYFPDDIAPDEPFSGAMESTRPYLFEFAGQVVRSDDGPYSWNVPAVKPGEFVPLVLRDLRGRELGRAAIPVNAAAGTPSNFRFPKVTQAGSAAPIVGPFDGALVSTSVTAAGRPVELFAESRRKLIFRSPEQIAGPVLLTLRKGNVERTAEIRNLLVEVRTPKPSLRLGETSTLDISVAGLSGLQTSVPLKLENKSPGVVNVFAGSVMLAKDVDYIFVFPSDVRTDGTFPIHRELEGLEPGSFDIALSVLIPQTPREEVGLILRMPAPRAEAPRLRAASLRQLDYDVFPVAEEFLTDFELGSDAAYALLETDEARALPRLFASMPTSGANIERIGFLWFLSHFVSTENRGSNTSAHEAAVSLLSNPAGVSTDVIELALLTLGATGAEADRALLETFYGSGSRMPGARRLRDASEAALARLGEQSHIENIRMELAPRISETDLNGVIRMVQSLQKAGFSGRTELLPAVCSHLDDPPVVDIDVTWDPKPVAVNALGAIVEKRTPLGVQTRRSLEEWKSVCDDAGR
jgi:hypothetical protein